MSPTGRPENGPVFLIKEDNVISEQTFLVSIQVETFYGFGTVIGQDIHLGQSGQESVTERFNASQQKIPFRFTLLPDTISEGPEDFLAYLYPVDAQSLPDGTEERFPTSFLGSFIDVLVTILDDDRKFQAHVILLPYVNFFLTLLAIVIGFTDTSYTVDEGVGTLQVDIRVFNVPDDQLLAIFVGLVIETVSGSASKCTELVYLTSIDHSCIFISWRK